MGLAAGFQVHILKQEMSNHLRAKCGPLSSDLETTKQGSSHMRLAGSPLS